MFLHITRIAILLLTIILVKAYAAAPMPLRAFVSIAPQKTFFQRLAGPQAQIGVLVQPGQDPHTYEPTPKQAASIAQADVYAKIGMPFEIAWIPRLQAVNPRMEVLDLVPLSINKLHMTSDDGVADGEVEDADHHDHNGLDPHIWTNPALVKVMALQIRDYLIKRDPHNVVFYQANYATFIADLNVLDQDIRATLAKSVNPCRFMVFHPAWGNFASEYGLTQVPIEHNGKPPGAKAIGILIDQAKAWNMRVIFVQPQFDRKTAQTLATGISGRVAILDPLAEDYFANMRVVAQEIAGACTP